MRRKGLNFALSSLKDGDCDDPPLHFGHASFAIGAVGQLQQQAAPLMTAMEPKHVAMQKETDSLCQLCPT